MDGNKDEALRCVRIVEEAIASGNKARALKFIKIAQRLNKDLSVDELLASCEKLDSGSNSSSVGEKCSDNGGDKPYKKNTGEGLSEERNYTEENVKLIRDVNKNKDYYAILGLEKTCSVEEIRKAYRKLSLKVHPDKNKAPGSEEAFKKVSKAFKCLSDSDSRRQYDQVGLVDEFEHNQQYNVRRRRTRTTYSSYYDDEFDPNEIFRSFFGQTDMFRTHHVYRSRGMGGRPREDLHGDTGGTNLILLLQILPFLLIFLLAYLPFSEPEYSLQRNYSYQFLRTTEKHGVEFFVKSHAFDENYPIGTAARANIEDNVIKDYRSMLWRYCHIEMQRRHWNRNLPTPNCNKLQSLEVA